MMNRLQQMKMLFKAILGASVAILCMIAVLLYKHNKKLTESLEMAENNIESYQNIINGVNEQNNTLELTVQQLQSSNDSLLMQLNNKAKENNIKLNDINTAATQTQSIIVNDSKGVQGDLVEIITKDSIYSDSIKYNDLTKVYYTIGKDTINIALDINNEQYLYTFKHKEWKNKKNFFKRLFTFDFKKVWKYKYKIINTNDIINTSNVRIIEIQD